MDGAKKFLCADLSLQIPGLDQKFRLYREQFGRHRTGIGDVYYRPTYEAVYESEPVINALGEYSSRSITKLIFESFAEEGQMPLRVGEVLATVPDDMMQFLVDMLSKYWAVVTFRNGGGETAFVINFDKSELWQQEESECDALGGAEDKVRWCPHIIIEEGIAYPVPGSKPYIEEE